MTFEKYGRIWHMRFIIKAIHSILRRPPQPQPATPGKKWYEDWTYHREIFAHNERRLTFTLPHSKAEKIIMFRCHTNDASHALANVLECALGALAKPAKYLVEDKHREDRS